MGEVYRARDTKLNRDVALKVLPDAFARDPDRLARFEREAQVLASLNHPHIGAIYGFEDSGETHALVLELVEGDDARRPDRARPAPAGRGAADRAADRGGARSGARAGHHPPRSEAGEHQGHARRHGEGARLRPGESASNRAHAPAPSARLSPTITLAGDECRRHSRHRGVHVARAGARACRRQAQRHLGVRRACSTRC